MNNFDSRFFANNRKKLLQNNGADAIILTGNGLLQRNGTATFPYRQNSNFWYLSGINQPDIVIVFSASQEFAVLPKRHSHRDAFDGAIDTKELTKISGIKQYYSSTEGWEKIKELSKNKTIGTILPTSIRDEIHGMFTNPSHKALSSKLRRTKPSSLVDVRVELARLRMVKQPAEIAAIKKAIKVTSQTVSKVAADLRKNFYYDEQSVTADITHAYTKAGYTHAFDPIIASGERACTIHYAGKPGKIAKNDLLLIDTGAEVSNYAADITRTYSVSEPSARQQQVWQAVSDVQDYALELLKPGVLIRDYEQKVEQEMGKVLKKLGVIKNTDGKSIRTYFPHATTHHLGLDVHDSADYKTPLTENMVLTVEPGIYIPEERIGVRIEDDIVITKNGNIVLSSSLPRRLW